MQGAALDRRRRMPGVVYIRSFFRASDVMKVRCVGLFPSGVRFRVTIVCVSFRGPFSLPFVCLCVFGY